MFCQENGFDQDGIVAFEQVIEKTGKIQVLVVCV
jgi:hypothetical protein